LIFWKRRFSLSECKAVLKDYLGRTMDKRIIALMNLAFAREAVHLSRDLGDFGDSFYTALENAAEKCLDYAKTDVDFYEAHKNEFDDLLDSASNCGYGVQYSLENMLDEVRDELYEGNYPVHLNR